MSSGSRWCAWGLVGFFLLHLIRFDTFAALPRLGSPSRALLFAPLLALPSLAGMPWPRLRKAMVLTGLLTLLAVYSLTESVIERQRGMAWFLVWICLILGTQAVSSSHDRTPQSTTTRGR